MTPERWNQIEGLFLQAVELPPSSRERFLDKVCNGDELLRKELVSLLACDDPKAPLVDSPFLAVDREEASDRRIGQYRLVRLLGRGGMGAVHLAVRDDDHFQKEVAIKLLKRGMDTDTMLIRFRQERQILANLEHPFIAWLLDGGATDEGLPYFVLEYVDGLPITKYCEERNLSLQERLNVFRLVCEAVQYAHQNLVVHRDLKPGNILITKEGVPKLLDFGIAKLIRPDRPAEFGTVTQREHRMITPDYASPEQVMGLPVSTATDIYALGAVLYELLTGSRPHQFASDSPTEMERIICVVEPDKPSLAASRMNQPQRSRQLAGDLDNIIQTAMRKEPQRRYASAAEFSEDIRRHMDGRPVVAREDRWAYRAGKFVRRNRLGVGAAVLVVASLIGGMVTTTLQARRAERRFQLVRGLAKSMLGDLNNQMERLPGATALRASMVQTVVQYLDSLAQDAGGDPTLDLEIANAYQTVAGVEGHPARQNLGKTAAALEHYAKALQIYRRHVDNNATRTWALGGIIGANIESGDIEARTGNFSAAAERLKEVAAIATEFEAKDSKALSPGTWVYVYFRLGDAEWRRGNSEAALGYYRKALEISKEWAAVDRTPNARSTLRGAYSRVAGSQMEIGDLYGARESYDLVVKAAHEAAQQPDSTIYERSNVYGAYQSLGDLLGNSDDLNLGDLSGALAQYRKAQKIAEELAATDPNDVRARGDMLSLYRRLGTVLLEQDPAQAALYFGKAVAIAEELSAANPSNVEYHRDVATTRLGLGQSLNKLGKNREALDHVTGAAKVTESVVAAGSYDLLWLRHESRAHRAAGDLLLDIGDARGALDHYQKGLASAEKLLGQAPSSLYFQRNRAEALESLGRYYLTLAGRPGTESPRQSELKSEARAWFQKSLAVWHDWNRRKVGAPFAARQEARIAASLATLDKM